MADYVRPLHATKDPVITGDYDKEQYHIIDAEGNVVSEVGSFRSQAEAHSYIRKHFMGSGSTKTHWMFRKL